MSTYSSYKPLLHTQTEDIPAAHSDSELLPLNKADVLQWFQDSEYDDAAWVLERLAETMPHLFSSLADMMSSDRSPKNYSMRASEIALPREPRRDPSCRLTGDPILQFISPVYYALEGVDDVMVLEVMRIGDKSRTSEVFYETEDESAVSGRSYVSCSGKLVFEPGASLSKVEVQVINNDLWDTTLEFKCRLKQEGLKNAELGRYLFETRVRIIDNDPFPTNEFTGLTSRQRIEESSKWHLLLGFFKLVSSIPQVWTGTIKYILVDVVHNLWYLLSLIMNVYLLDYIVDTTSPTSDLLLIQNRKASLLVCSLFLVASVAIFHILDYSRISFPIRGPTTNFLQSALLRKFLNYKRVVREHLMPGDVIMSMNRDVVDLINLGYFSLLQLLTAVGHLFAMLVFKLSAPVLFGTSYDWNAVVLLVAMPAVLVIFVYCRQETTSAALQKKNRALSDFTTEISMITTNYHLVIDYSLRNHCVERFQEKLQKHSLSFKDASLVLQNNSYFCKWCTSLTVAIWILYGGLQVIDGSLSIGLFVTNTTLLGSFGHSFLQIYDLTIEIMMTFPALVSVTTLMNYQTDVNHRYQLNRMQQEAAKENRASIRKMLGSHNDIVAIDLMPIVVNFSIPFTFEQKKIQLNFRGHLEVHQGQMIAVVGPIGCGKATLLRLIAGSVLPAEGRESPIFVPSHLRIANVADEAIFFDGTLYENLTFGMDRSQPDASKERVKSICKRLTQSRVITDHLDKDDEQSWSDIFSGAQGKLLSVARALVHNVELMTIHKPLARLIHEDALHVVQALHEHVEFKGLDLTTDSTRRRPRTVIVSAASDRATKEANNVIHVHPLHGIRLEHPE